MRCKPPLVLLLIALAIGGLAGCVPLPPPAPISQVGSAATPAPNVAATRPRDAAQQPVVDAGSLSGCPSATETLQRLVNTEARYCFAYPEEFKVEKPGGGEVILVIGGLLDASNPRLHVNVSDAAGRTASEAADAIVSDFRDFELERGMTTVANASAEILDRVPGQEINRRIIFVNEGLLYELTFYPADPSLGDTFAGMEALQEQVLGSFAFLPAGLPPVSECLAPDNETQLFHDPEMGFCMLYPAGYTVQRDAATGLLVYSGSLQDVDSPRLSISIEAHDGRTAQQLAGAVIADAQAAVPGAQVERSFGATIGYVPAELLHRVPGQDLARMLVVVNDRRVYAFSFSPDDPAQQGAFEQMEELYDLVLRSLRFLE